MMAGIIKCWNHEYPLVYSCLVDSRRVVKLPNIPEMKERRRKAPVPSFPPHPADQSCSALCPPETDYCPWPSLRHRAFNYERWLQGPCDTPSNSLTSHCLIPTASSQLLSPVQSIAHLPTLATCPISPPHTLSQLGPPLRLPCLCLQPCPFPPTLYPTVRGIPPNPHLTVRLPCFNSFSDF